ncbi:MAG: dynamin family protein [Candidatus Competibacteraceae bacterium]
MVGNVLVKERVLQVVQEFLTLTKKLNEPRAAERIQAPLEQYRLGLFRLVVIGEIKKGKSSFINALLGETDLLPAYSAVATSTVYKVMYGPTRKYTAFFQPLNPERPKETPALLEIDTDRVANYGTEDGNPDNRKGVDFIGVEAPSPLLKTGLVIVDTPGLGGLFREHSYITWRYVPNADAVFFILDSVEAVAGQAEMDALAKLRSITPLLFFVQTKIDLMDSSQWQQWRDRNLDIIARQLQLSRDKLLYFPVSAKLKELADRRQSPKDLERSGFPPLLHFFHDHLLKAKETRLAQVLLEAITAETADIRRRLNDELTIVTTETREALETLECEFNEAKTRFEQWRIREYQPTVNRFQDSSSDLKRETYNQLQNQAGPSPHGPVVGALIARLRQQSYSAEQMNRMAAERQSFCIDGCAQLVYSIQNHYDQGMQNLIADRAQTLGKSFTGHVSGTKALTKGHFSVPMVESLNMHFSHFERARTALYGTSAGGMLAGVVGSLIFPPAGAAFFLASLLI